MLHMMATLAFLVVLEAPEASFPVSLDSESVRGLVVQADGRWPPLDTVARDTVEKVTGEAFCQGHDPVLLLLAWAFAPESWGHQPLIEIENAELRRELQLSPTQTVFSYAELVNHKPFLAQLKHLSHIERGRKLNPLESKVSDISDKLGILQRAFNDQVIRLIPDPDSINGEWHSVGETMDDQGEGIASVRSAWAALKHAFLNDDAPAFSSAAERLNKALAKLPAAYRPNPSLIATELRYNRLQPFRIAWVVMVVGAVLAAVAIGIRRKWFDVLAVVGMLAGFVVLTYGLSLRWQIAGRIPASNMFESLLFLSWGMGAFAILSMLLTRDRSIPLTASAMGALALVLAERLLPHFIRPIVPVLQDTVWMSIHVPVIMVSYSILALAMLTAHVQIAVMAFAPGKRRLVAAIDARHYWYIHVGSILLLAGIITGSMWGASSWGRYWGWDPKEVWSLVAFVGYLTILHVRADHKRQPRWAYAIGALMVVALFVLVVPKLVSFEEPVTALVLKLLAFAGTAAAVMLFIAAHGRLATALKSVLCFWLILMTYLGVNYVLGIGLHSYGFGTGAVARYMLLIGGIDLGVVVALCVIYLARRPAEASPVPVTA